MHRLVRLTRGSIGVAGVVAVLVAAAPDPVALGAGLTDADRWMQRDGLDLVLAQLVGAVAWLAALWLAVGLSLMAGSRLPGAVGRVSWALARGALPAGVRQTAAMALGVSLATSTLPAFGAAPATAAAADRWTAAEATDSPATAVDRRCDVVRMDTAAPAGPWSTVDLATASTAICSRVDWPVAGVLARGIVDAVGVGERVDWPLEGMPEVAAAPAARPDPPSVDWPVGRSTTASPAGRVRPSIVDWPTAAVPRSTAAARPLAAGTWRVLVVVRPGDTLWSLASRRLGPGATAPAIAAEWRRWHAANHDVIGPDPRRLRPGVSLRVPAGSDPAPPPASG